MTEQNTRRERSPGRNYHVAPGRGRPHAQTWQDFHELRAAGLRKPEIAERLGVTRAGLNWALYRYADKLGIPRPKPDPRIVQGHSNYVRQPRRSDGRWVRYTSGPTTVSQSGADR